ncbi:enoyl-CoA hydratase/isomerase family protein [bacterium]|nr:enoyl-CoA hydratase/isomerase family protein [bacterium]MBU1025494.1 enoyl-CoA hydratase/isomerase family protein [bacterium]
MTQLESKERKTFIEDISEKTSAGNIYNDIEVIKDYPFVIIRINREGDQLNTLSISACKELDSALNDIWDDSESRVLILTGNDRVFSTGADVGSIRDISPHEARHFARSGKMAFGRLEELNIPTIAAINGLCLGGGLELALCCDFRIATQKARFAQSEVNIGIIPGWGGCVRLPRTIGQTNAMRMIMSGDMINAKEALALGLISSIVPSNESVIDFCKEFAKPFVSRSRIALMYAKKAVKTGMEIPLKYANDLESELFGFAWASEDREEGIDAFLKKEKPNWKHK